MKWLKEENKELQTQMSKTGPSQSWHTQRGQKVLLWQLFKTVQGGIFVESPSTTGWRNHLYPGIQEYEVRQKVAFIRCNTSPTRTSGAKRGGAITHVRDSKGSFRSPSCDTYVRRTFSTIKAASWSIVDESSTRLYQLTVEWHVLHVVWPPYH